MSTITELMDGADPGTVRISRPDWGKGVWFAPYFTAKSLYTTKAHWFGVHSTGIPFAWSAEDDDWQLWAPDSTTPTCVCASPYAHDNDCKWLQWKRSKA